MSEPDLTNLERRLGAWLPARDRLDADAMLFAAGRASARNLPARFAWPTIAACLALAAGLLGNRLITERAENHQLVARLHQSEFATQANDWALTTSDRSNLAGGRA